MADAADLLCLQLRAAGIPHQREVMLVPGRRYRTDIVIDRLAIEVDGAVWVQGRHSRGAGIETDCEKQNLVVGQGYVPMRVTTGQVKSGQALRWIEAALEKWALPLDIGS